MCDELPNRSGAARRRSSHIVGILNHWARGPKIPDKDKVDESLAADEAIVFNAGTRRDAIRIRYDDFVRLAKPRICSFARKE